jgi:hypothetical protein
VNHGRLTSRLQRGILRLSFSQLEQNQMKAYIKAGLVAVAAVAVVAYLQRNVITVPLIGAYLPK